MREAQLRDLKPNEYCACDLIKKNKMDCVCEIVRHRRGAYKDSVGKTQTEDSLIDQDVDVNIIFKNLSPKNSVEV
jgi:hypothetical protein